MNFLICLPRLKSGATDILFLLDISQNRVIEHLQTSSTRGLLLFYHMTNFIISKSDSVSVLSVGHTDHFFHKLITGGQQVPEPRVLNYYKKLLRNIRPRIAGISN